MLTLDRSAAETEAASTPAAILQQKQTTLLHHITRDKAYFQRIAYAILKNEGDAEDAVQNAFYAAWRALDNFRGDAAMKTWLTQIVINKARGQLAATRRNHLISIEEAPADLAAFELQHAHAVPNPELLASHNETIATLCASIADLPSETREVLLLFYFHEKSIQEIAAERGRSISAIKAYLHRGRNTLAKQASYTISRRRSPSTRYNAVYQQVLQAAQPNAVAC